MQSIWIIDNVASPFGQAIVRLLERYPAAISLTVLLVGIAGLLLGLWKRKTPAWGFILLWVGLTAQIIAIIYTYWRGPFDRPAWMIALGIVAGLVCGASAAIMTRHELKRESRNKFQKDFNLSTKLLGVFCGVYMEPETVFITNTGSSKTRRWIFFLAMAIVLLIIAVPVRSWRLADYPHFFYSEHAESGRWALETIESGKPWLWVNFSAPADDYHFLLFVEKIHLLLVDAWAALFLLFGSSIAVMKLLPTLIGIAVVFAIWLFGRRWVGPGAGEAAAIMLAVSPYMIGLSRKLWTHIIFTVLFALVVFYLVLLSLEKPRWRNIIAACVGVSLSVYMYRAAYIIIPITGLFFIIQLIFSREWRRQAWKPLIAGSVVGLIIAAPFFVYVVEKNYIDYLGGGSISSDVNKSRNEYLSENAVTIAARIFYLGDDHMFPGIVEKAGYSGVLHMPIVTALFLLGLGAMLTGLRRSRIDQVMFLWLLLSTLPALMSILPPPRRLIMSDPIVYLLAGRGAVGILGWIAHLVVQRHRWIVWAGAGAAAIVLSCTGIGIYTGMAEGFTLDHELQQAEYVAEILPNHFVVNLYNDFGLEDTTYILLWDRMKMNEVRRRWNILPSPGTIRYYTLPDDCPSSSIVMLARPPGDNSNLKSYKKQLDKRFLKLQEEHPDWSLKYHFDMHKKTPELTDLIFISFTVPKSQFEDARDFAYRALSQWIPDSDMTFNATGEDKRKFKQGLLRREGSLPLWESPRTAMTIVEPNLHFLYNNEEKPFESPWWYWWRGRILIPEDGIYSFALESDDGSDLWFNHVKVINNMGDHAMLRESNSVNLKKGFHIIEIRYYDGMLGAGLKVEMRGPNDNAWKPLPLEWLYYQPEEGAVSWNAK